MAGVPAQGTPGRTTGHPRPGRRPEGIPGTRSGGRRPGRDPCRKLAAGWAVGGGVVSGTAKDSESTLELRRFRPYPTYKDSGVEWLGEIPAHWAVKRLWHLTPSDRRIMYGIVLPGPNVADGVPIVKGGDVSPEPLRLASLNRTTFEIESGYARSR